jgi:hypothetical protein
VYRRDACATKDNLRAEKRIEVPKQSLGQDWRSQTGAWEREKRFPFEKGGFMGISSSYKIPLNPPLEKGGIKTALNKA